jgi:L-ascorbate metabolism protein UlaG (beta-lactamase superfamily)
MSKLTRFILYLIFFLSSISQLACNIFYITLRNVPVFFSVPDDVPNKIKDPIKDNVRLSALWVGHSTFLIQMDDKVIITDPLFTETVGVMARRVVDPGIDLESIPKCDLIIITHSHFDHLSIGSLEMLEEKFPGTALVFPNDLENYIPSMNFNMIRMSNDNGYKEKIIGEQRLVNGIKVSTVYAQHWGGRYALDGYVWGDKAFTGYVLEYNGISFYFAGDTGYDSVKFKELGSKFKLDAAFIPIGPCAECFGYGTRNHVFPPDALRIFGDLKARWMVPMHYGTLYFAQAEPFVPVYALKSLIQNSETKSTVVVLGIGEQRIFMEK